MVFVLEKISYQGQNGCYYNLEKSAL